MANIEYQPELAELIATGYGVQPPVGQAWPEFLKQQWEIEFDGVDDVIVLEQDGQPAASLSLKIFPGDSGTTAYIQGIVVKPELQQQGLGMQLLEKLLEEHQPQIIYGETNSLGLVKTLLKFSQQQGWAMVWGNVLAGEYGLETQQKLKQLVEADGGAVQTIDPQILAPLNIDNLLLFPGNFKATAGAIVKKQLAEKQACCAPFVLVLLTEEDKWLQQTKVTIADVLLQKKEPLGSEKLQLEFELRVIHKSVPEEIWVEADNLWLSIRKFMDIPKVGDISQEIKHPFGPVNAFANGLIKSLHFGRPMLELHATACPSYVPFEQWEKQGLTGSEIAAGKIIPGIIEALQKVTGWLAPYAGKYFDKLTVHTPSPADRGCDFCNHMEEHVLMPKNGHDQLANHWVKMQELIKLVPGMELAADLPYLTQFLTKEGAEKLMAQDLQLTAAFEQFITSRYVYDSYLRWGPVNKLSIFCGLYLGTVMAYGNHESVFNINNPAPVKLYFNFEEHNGPETFAGLMTGVDVRHILAEYGYHLPLLVADHRLRTPWLEN